MEKTFGMFRYFPARLDLAVIGVRLPFCWWPTALLPDVKSLFKAACARTRAARS